MWLFHHIFKWIFSLACKKDSNFSVIFFRFYEKADSSSSRKLFRFSLIHLPLLMTLMWVSKTQLAPSDETKTAAPLADNSGDTASC